MKIEIDNLKKTIKVEDNINLGELIEFLDKLLQEEWKEYTLITTIVKNYNGGSNIYIPLQQPYIPWTRSWYTGSPIYCAQNGTTTSYCSTTQTLN